MPCHADRVYIDINAPYLRKIPTAIPVFKDMAGGQAQGHVAHMLTDLLAASIDFTGFFKILDPDSFLEDPDEAGLVQHIKEDRWVNYLLADGRDNPYAANLLGNLKHWLEDDPEITTLIDKLQAIDRIEICCR